MSEMVAWKCPDGHVLGQVRRNGSKVQRLLLYRAAVSYESSPMGAPGASAISKMEEVEVMAVVEGLVIDVRCSICGGIRTWRPGKPAWPKNNPPAPPEPKASNSIDRGN